MTDRVSLIQAFSHFFPDASEPGSYVGGRLLSGAGDAVDLYDPATGALAWRYRDGAAAVVQTALQAATDAQQQW